MGEPSRSLAQRFSDLRVRILSAAVLAAVGGLAVWAGGVWFAGLVAVLAGAIAWEWRSVTHHGGERGGLDAVYLIGAVAGCVLVAEIWSAAAGFWWLGIALALGLGWDVLTGRKTAAFWALIGGAWCGSAGIALVWLRGLEARGLESVTWIILVVAAADIGAYFSGKTFGGPKLWPRVSPKKTWAGVIGGLALAAVAGVGLGLAFGATEVGGGAAWLALVAVAVALVSQAGDLAESALKRHFGVKDAGRLLPGHGGALDRFDGLAPAVIAVALASGAIGGSVVVG